MKAEPTPEMIAMARRIHAEHDPDKAYQYLDGSRDDYPDVKATLAAIIETTNGIQRLLGNCAEPCPQCWEAIERGDHLKEQSNAE